MNQTVAQCWCSAPIARRPGRGRPAQFCSRAHNRSLQRDYRRRHQRAARRQRRLDALPRPAAAAVPDAWGVEQLTRAVYRQALADRDTAWLAARTAQGLWADILDVLRAATVTGMD